MQVVFVSLYGFPYLSEKCLKLGHESLFASLSQFTKVPSIDAVSVWPSDSVDKQITKIKKKILFILHKEVLTHAVAYISKSW
jgi:hypothetical protein